MNGLDTELPTCIPARKSSQAWYVPIDLGLGRPIQINCCVPHFSRRGMNSRTFKMGIDPRVYPTSWSHKRQRDGGFIDINTEYIYHAYSWARWALLY